MNLEDYGKIKDVGIFNEKLMDELDKYGDNVMYNIPFHFDKDLLEIYLKDRSLSCTVDIKSGIVAFDIPRYGIDPEENSVKYVLSVLALKETIENDQVQ